jgi:hypothetical protein
VFAGALTVYVDPVNGTDAPGGGTLSAPYASINYAYSQVTSLGNPSNSTYNASVGQFVTEKLIFQLAPGRYVEDVTLGFKRARVQLIGNGVQIVGNVKMSAVRADFPASSMEALKASFPAPWAGVSAQMTFEITGEAGGGVEADTTADPLVVTGLSSLAFEESAFAGSGVGSNWDNNYGQFNFYANKANLIGGMVLGTSYTVPTTNGLPTSIIEIDGCTVGEAGVVRSYIGAVPYAYVSSPSTWSNGTGQATGTQSGTTLQDTTKAWTVNQYAGATVSLTGGTGSGQTATVVSNTATTLTLSTTWGTTPVANSTIYSLVGTANKAPTGTITLKCHNSTLAAALGPRLTLGEVDGCRIYDIDRSMLGTVDNGAVTGSTSTSYIGFVVNQFRVYSGTGVPASQYRIGSSSNGTRYKMDSTSYTTLAFSRNSSGVLSARTLNPATSSGTATAGAATTITDTSKAFTTNQWTGGTITLTGGTGSGQTRTVSSNTATAITVSPAWTINPAAGTTYTVTALVAFDFLDEARSLAYTPTTSANWSTVPATVGAGLDSLASDKQPVDATLTALAGLATAADALPYFTGTDVASTTTLSSFARTLIDDADAATARTTLGLGTAATQNSTAFQSADATLTALAGVTTAADKLPYFTGVDTAAVADITTAGREILSTASSGTNGQVLTSSGGGAPTWTTVSGGGGGGGAIDVQAYSADGTWTKPAGAQFVEVIAIGGGGGGGSGRLGAPASTRGGGAGGGGAGITRWMVPAAALGATVAVTVGQGGAGGAPQLTSGVNGNAGSPGTASTFGAHVYASGGFGGAGGAGTVAPIGGAGASASIIPGGVGGNGGAGATGSPTVGASALGAAGGGGGGSVTTGNTQQAGANGGAGSPFFAGASALAGGAGGATGGTAGSVGTSTSSSQPFGGGGGGGGGANHAAAGSAPGGDGGNGGSFGAGGGGGGGGTTSTTSGQSGEGGAGANGIVYVITY